jgi:hypothetical protein
MEKNESYVGLMRECQCSLNETEMSVEVIRLLTVAEAAVCKQA